MNYNWCYFFFNVEIIYLFLYNFQYFLNKIVDQVLDSKVVNFHNFKFFLEHLNFDENFWKLNTLK